MPDRPQAVLRVEPQQLGALRAAFLEAHDTIANHLEGLRRDEQIEVPWLDDDVSRAEELMSAYTFNSYDTISSFVESTPPPAVVLAGGDIAAAGGRGVGSYPSADIGPAGGSGAAHGAGGAGPAVGAATVDGGGGRPRGSCGRGRHGRGGGAFRPVVPGRPDPTTATPLGPFQSGTGMGGTGMGGRSPAAGPAGRGTAASARAPTRSPRRPASTAAPDRPFPSSRPPAGEAAARAATGRPTTGSPGFMPMGAGAGSGNDERGHPRPSWLIEDDRPPLGHPARHQRPGGSP